MQTVWPVYVLPGFPSVWWPWRQETELYRAKVFEGAGESVTERRSNVQSPCWVQCVRGLPDAGLSDLFSLFG